jgi:hypothetical protein
VPGDRRDRPAPAVERMGVHIVFPYEHERRRSLRTAGGQRPAASKGPRRLGGATRVGNLDEQAWGESPERRQSNVLAGRAGTSRMTHPTIGKITSRARHQKGITHPGAGPDGVARDHTATSKNDLGQYTPDSGVRIDTGDVQRVPAGCTAESASLGSRPPRRPGLVGFCRLLSVGRRVSAGHPRAYEGGVLHLGRRRPVRVRCRFPRRPGVQHAVCIREPAPSSGLNQLTVNSP